VYLYSHQFLGELVDMTATLKSKRFEHNLCTAFGPPFDDLDADIILRSSDKVDFLVYKVILSKASSVFKSMFSLPQPATDITQDSRLVVDVAENSKVLAALVSAIYPDTLAIADPLSLNDFIATLATADKYDMATASRRLLVDFTNSKAFRDAPLEAFCAAHSRELGDAARIAARESLKLRLTLNDIGTKLPFTNGPALYALWKYHRACSSAAIKATNCNFEWIKKAHSQVVSSYRVYKSCTCNSYRIVVGPDHASFTVNVSWREYLDRASDALRMHPCSEAVTQAEILKPSFEKEMCDKCRKEVCNLSAFSRHLGEEVERLVSEVRGPLTSSLLSLLTWNLWRFLWICIFDPTVVGRL
jgi:BTB/POZ domain